MKILSILIVFAFLLGCSHLSPEIKSRDMNVSVFNGEGESIKIYCDGKLVLDKHNLKLNDFGVSAYLTIPRTKNKMLLMIHRGATVKAFTINPQRIGDLDIIFETSGGISIEDASKSPPLVLKPEGSDRNGTNLSPKTDFEVKRQVSVA